MSSVELSHSAYEQYEQQKYCVSLKETKKRKENRACTCICVKHMNAYGGEGKAVTRFASADAWGDMVSIPLVVGTTTTVSLAMTRRMYESPR